MKVCDHCHQAVPIRNTIKLNGKTFELCTECSEALIARIESTPNKKGVFQSMFGN